MNFNVYLPFHRKTKKGEEPPQPSRLLRAARRIFPSTFFSDPATGKLGRVRRVLKNIGTTWHSSPWRRVVQAGFFIAFLVFFCWVCWPYGGTNYAEHRESKEKVAAETFLIIDPLVSLSTAIASRSWVWSLSAAGVILLVCVFIPRGFCGYVCPLGTLIDLFDWAVGKRINRFKLKDETRGWWVNLKYYVLLACLVAGMFGVLLTGFVAAIPVVTRAMLFIVSPLQMGAERGFYQIPAWNWGHAVSLVLFAAVLGLGLFRRRFWCQYVCPSGAVFSIGNLFRVTQRKVESSCISCNKCVEVCPFDAIKSDYHTRAADCTLCQSCGGVCPTHSIKFVSRWDFSNLKKDEAPPDAKPSRRGFLTATLAGAASAFSIQRLAGAKVIDTPPKELPVRPPGSVPEQEFLEKCIRCGECFQACPNNVLQPMGFKQGLEGLWTPEVIANWAGCEAGCNNCGQVCPTGAIRALPMEEKRVARMGLAIVDQQTCLPIAGREACQMCVDECNAAGYKAIEFARVHVKVDEEGQPVPDSGFLAPVVLADKCVGCGLCQTRCNLINVKAKGLLKETAIWVEAGPGKEDRMSTGSYVELRFQEQKQREAAQPKADGDSYLPDFLKDK
jgi:polyferredoxin